VPSLVSVRLLALTTAVPSFPPVQPKPKAQLGRAISDALALMHALTPPSQVRRRCCQALQYLHRWPGQFRT